MKIWRLAFAMLAAFSLASCNSDNDYEDKVEQVTVYVSAETGMFYNVPNTTPEEGMRILIEGEDHYICVGFTPAIKHPTDVLRFTETECK